MTSIKDHPPIKLRDIIYVSNTICVVCQIYENSQFGVCEVVFNPVKPTNHDVEWDGEKWVFADRPDIGGYADKYPRLREFVSILKQGG